MFKSKLTCYTIAQFTGKTASTTKIEVALVSYVRVVTEESKGHRSECSISMKANLSSSDTESAIMEMPARF